MNVFPTNSITQMTIFYTNQSGVSAVAISMIDKNLITTVQKWGT